MDPITLVLSMMVKIFFWIVKIIILLFKYGFGWLLIGYFIDYEVLGNPGGTQHVLCMLLAWGGTFIHFFGKKIVEFLKKKSGWKNRLKS